MLRLIISKDWIAVRNEIMRCVAEDTAKQLGGRILLVPELITHDTERRLCAAAGDTASRFAEVLSFTRLTRSVAEYTAHAPESCMDNGGRGVAMAAAAGQIHSRLKFYAAVQTKPEFLTELVDAVDEFKRCCITPADLMKAAGETEGAFSQKLTELSLLLEAYDAICAHGKRDPRDQMNWLLEQLEDCDFAKEHVFYIDGFPDFTRQNMAILEHLIRHCPNVTVGLNCDALDSDALAFEKAADTAAQLYRFAKKEGIPVHLEVVSGRKDALAPVRDALFQGKLPSISQGVKAVKAESAWEEVTFAADQIRQLTSAGCRYRDIGVVCGDPAGYQHILQQVFHRYGIPLYLSGTEDILQKTVVATVLAAMDAALGGFERRDVLRYLKSCLSPLDPDTCDQVENYAILWGIQGKRWCSPWQAHPEGLGKDWNEHAAAQLAALNEARELAILPLKRLADEFTAAADLKQQVLALYHFLEQIDLAGRLESLATELDAAGDNRSAQILHQLWEILLTAMEQMHDVLGHTVWKPEEFLRLFVLLLSQYTVGTIPPMLDAVTAGPVSAMRCQQQKHLIVLGAAEGALPGYSGSAGVLTDQERVALRSLGIPLTGGAQEGLQAEFAEIYGVFCGAEETLTVCCSSQSSYIFHRIADMCGGEVCPARSLGSACADAQDAAFLLAGSADADAAHQLGLDGDYFAAARRLDHALGNVQPGNVRVLYGKRLNLSASQVDRQAECRLSYFLRYGLGAKERKEATVDPAEFGTYVHAVLEKTVKTVMDEGGFRKVSLERTLQIARDNSAEYIRNYFSQLDSGRTAYLFKRNSAELELVVTELWQELKDSLFLPAGFEVAFGDGGQFPAIRVGSEQMEAVLRGFVDRVDVWQAQGCRYFRVVDYKTGKKDFDYCDVFNGIGLQMLLYLFALEQMGQEVTGDNAFSAGVQYFPARVPLLTADGRLSDEEAAQLRAKEWKRKGLLLSDEDVLRAMEPSDDPQRLCCTRKKDGSLQGDLADRDQLRSLESYIRSLLRGMVEQIASGDIQPNPYTRGAAHSACTFCPYGSICHEADVPGRRNYERMTAQRFWEEVEREVADHG